MITMDNLAELLSAVPGAEPRLTNSRYTHRFLGFLRSVCGMCVSVQNTCRQACAVSLYLRIDSVTGKTCTSAWLIREGLAREVTFDLGHYLMMDGILISRNGDGQRPQENGSLTWGNGKQAICGESLGGEGLECQAKEAL